MGKLFLGTGDQGLVYMLETRIINSPSLDSLQIIPNCRFIRSCRLKLIEYIATQILMKQSELRVRNPSGGRTGGQFGGVGGLRCHQVQ
jgi:hypothetical protein